MYSEEELDKLEQEEYDLTEESLIILLLLLSSLKEDLQGELQKFYQKYGSDGIVTYQEARKWVSDKDHRRRLTVLLLTITDKFDLTLPQLNSKLKSLLTKISGKESDFFNVEINVDKTLNTKWGVDDSKWSDRLADDVLLWTAYIMNDIKRSMIKRDNIEKVLKQVDKRFDTIENVLNASTILTRNVLERLVLSESTAVGSIARKEIFKELGVEKYQFFTRADERTCDVCGSLHGVIFPMSAYEVGVTASPVHPFVDAGKFLLSEIKTSQLNIIIGG